MSDAIIKIDKKNYKVKFSYSSLKSLAKIYNCKKLSGLDKIFKKLNFKEGTEPTFDQLEIIGNIIFSGIKNANKELDFSFDADDVMEVLISDSEKMAELLQLFTNSIQKVGGK